MGLDTVSRPVTGCSVQSRRHVERQNRHARAVRPPNQVSDRTSWGGTESVSDQAVEDQIDRFRAQGGVVDFSALCGPEDCSLKCRNIFKAVRLSEAESDVDTVIGQVASGADSSSAIASTPSQHDDARWRAAPGCARRSPSFETGWVRSLRWRGGPLPASAPPSPRELRLPCP